jgi:hypothetical protein
VFRDIQRLLELEEMDHFYRLRGRYVRTGRLMDSLTQPTANDAIRDVHGDGAGLTFGTSTWYAKFLTKRRKESDDGQVKGRKRKGKSAVLVLRAPMRKQVAEMLMEHVVEPFDAGS